jgi:hypothetical protein
VRFGTVLARGLLISVWERNGMENSGVVKWEYRFLVCSLTSSVMHEIQDRGPFEEAEGWLNRAGSDGWEVVALVPKMGANGAFTVALLKRPKAA